MRFWIFMIAALACSAADAQEAPSSWMLLLRTDTGATFAPTTYETASECRMLADRIEEHTAYRADCLPAHYAQGDVATYEAAQKADDDARKKRTAEIAAQRPALEAERAEITSLSPERRTLKQMQRLNEIETLIGPVPAN